VVKRYFAWTIIIKYTAIGSSVFCVWFHDRIYSEWSCNDAENPALPLHF